jgi:hypothetical protein
MISSSRGKCAIISFAKNLSKLIHLKGFIFVENASFLIILIVQILNAFPGEKFLYCCL